MHHYVKCIGHKAKTNMEIGVKMTLKLVNIKKSRQIENKYPVGGERATE